MGQIKNLHGLKFLLAIGIIVGHIGFFLDLGHFGVCLFFVISGYLLEKKYLRQGRSFTLKDVKKSFVKIMPAYISMLLLFVALQYVQSHKFDLISVISHLTMTQSIFQYSAARPLNGPSWYLSSYFTLFVLYTGLYRIGGGKKWLIVLFVLLWGIAYQSIEDKHWWTYRFPIAHLAEFSLGRALVYLPGKLISMCKRWALYLQVFAIALFVLTLTTANLINYDFIRDDIYFIIPSLVIVAIFIYTDDCSTIINKFLSHRFIQWGGVMCLQIYLYHYLFVKLTRMALPSASIFVQAVIVFSVTLLFAYFMKKWFEEPVLKCFKQ